MQEVPEGFRIPKSKFRGSQINGFGWLGPGGAPEASPRRRGRPKYPWGGKLERGGEGGWGSHLARAGPQEPKLFLCLSKKWIHPRASGSHMWLNRCRNSAVISGSRITPDVLSCLSVFECYSLVHDDTSEANCREPVVISRSRIASDVFSYLRVFEC